MASVRKVDAVLREWYLFEADSDCPARWRTFDPCRLSLFLIIRIEIYQIVVIRFIFSPQGVVTLELGPKLTLF